MPEPGVLLVNRLKPGITNLYFARFDGPAVHLRWHGLVLACLVGRAAEFAQNAYITPSTAQCGGDRHGDQHCDRDDPRRRQGHGIRQIHSGDEEQGSKQRR
jgi:hypothetical protein